MRRAGAVLAGVFFLVVFLVAGPAWAATIDVSACGTTVPPGATGVLTADLQCEYRCTNDPPTVCDPNEDDPCPGGSCQAQVIALGRGATLDLGGHTIFFAYQAHAVDCGTGDQGSCTVVGPGSIVGGKGTGIEGGSRDVRAANLFINNTDSAIRTDGSIFAKDVNLGFREEWLSAGRDIQLDNVVLGPAGAAAAGDLLATHVNGGTLGAGGRIRARDVVLDAAMGRDVFLRRATAAQPDPVSGAPLLSVMATRRLMLHRSAVGDIESGKRPMLIKSTCETSTVAGTAEGWGVCAND
jgi:hypothetical protein